MSWFRCALAQDHLYICLTTEKFLGMSGGTRLRREIWQDRLRPLYPIYELLSVGLLCGIPQLEVCFRDHLLPIPATGTWVRCGYFTIHLSLETDHAALEATLQIKRYGMRMKVKEFSQGGSMRCRLEPTGADPDLEDVYVCCLTWGPLKWMPGSRRHGSDRSFMHCTVSAESLGTASPSARSNRSHESPCLASLLHNPSVFSVRALHLINLY